MRTNIRISLFLLVSLFVSSIGMGQKAEAFKVSADGLKYQLFKVSKETAHPVTGDWISMNMRYSAKVNGKDTLLFDNRVQLQGVPVKFELPPSDFKGDLYEGIKMLSPGDSGYFLIQADSLFVKTFRMKERPAMIDANTDVLFFVNLLSMDAPADMQKKEIEALKKYLADNKVTVAPTATGVYIIQANDPAGQKIDTNSMVRLHFIVSDINGKQIFSSYERQEPMQFKYGQKFDTPGIEEAVGTMKKGSKAKVIVPSSMAFGAEGRGSVVLPYTTLVYDVEIVDVLSQADYEKAQAEMKKQEQVKKDEAKQNEQVILDKYLKDNNITTQPRPSGLIYIEKEAGKGVQATAGKQVSVHYTGTLLNGTKFDSSRDRNEPFQFTLGKGMVIKGWDEGIALMKVGGKATLIIPSAIAYGDRDMGDIPPYSTLIFEVELMDVK